MLYRAVSLLAGVLAGLACLPGVALAKGGRSPLDTRAPDVFAPTAHLEPAGHWDLDYGLGAATGPNAPQPPVTPVPQVLGMYGISERTDLLVGMFGPGPTAFVRQALVPDRLNVEAGVQSWVIPAISFGPLAELQLDVPLGRARLHLVPGVQQMLGARTDFTSFGVIGLECPIGEAWDLSGSLKTTYSTALPLDVGPSLGLRYRVNAGTAVEGVFMLLAGAPTGLVMVGNRF
jgi:hypothetical protein